MSDEKGSDAPETAEEERLGCLARIIPVTTPGCATLLTAIFLITTVLTVWIIFWLDPNNVPWRHSFSVWRILGIVALVATIPWVVYKTISVWLEGTPNAYPELDYAWRAGLNALAANELSIDSVPIFLITGSSGEAQEKAIMSASGLRLSVEGVPQGPAPIHWYANSEAIYLFCSDASWTSALASLREEIALEAAASGLNAEMPLITQSSLDFAEAFARSAPAQEEAPQATGSNIRGTLELNDFVNPTANKPAPQPVAAPPSPPPQQNSFRGTLILGEGVGEVASPMTSNEPAPTAAPRVLQQAPAVRQPSALMTGEVNTLSNRKPVLVSHQYSTACLQ